MKNGLAHSTKGSRKFKESAGFPKIHIYTCICVLSDMTDGLGLLI